MPEGPPPDSAPAGRLPSPVDGLPRCHGAPTLTLPCRASSGALCAPLTVDQALAAGYAPPGGWGLRAEDWAAERDGRAWAVSSEARRLRRDLAQERAEVADLCAELHGRQGEVPGV